MCVSICLSMCQSVCVSVHLFTVTLKFFDVSLVPELELKKCRLLIKIIRNSSKNDRVGGGLVIEFGRKQPLQQLKFLLLF